MHCIIYLLFFLIHLVLLLAFDLFFILLPASAMSMHLGVAWSLQHLVQQAHSISAGCVLVRAQSAEKILSFFKEQMLFSIIGWGWVLLLLVGRNILPLKSLLSKYTSSRFFILDMLGGDKPIKRFENTSNISIMSIRKNREPLDRIVNLHVIH